ncbi:hypothetical protein ABW19_dt0202499 [Dactylella cylindrospora]|nr:hypothetical protein ABW19_dt0202499 [Dactylella cylindrospora]
MKLDGHDARIGTEFRMFFLFSFWLNNFFFFLFFFLLFLLVLANLVRVQTTAPYSQNENCLGNTSWLGPSTTLPCMAFMSYSMILGPGHESLSLAALLALDIVEKNVAPDPLIA